MPERQQSGEKVLRGIPVSAGVCRGKVLVLDRTRHAIPKRELADAEVPDELVRLERALVQARHQMQEVQRKVTETMGAEQGSIFDAHMLALEDPMLIDEVVRVIQEKKSNAEHAFHSVAERYAAALATVDDEYLRERAADMRDVSARVMDNLLGVKNEFDVQHIKEPSILVAHDLSPSTTAQLDVKSVLGFGTDIGGKTSHTAIMARSLGIPAVVGLQTVSQDLQSGDFVLLDGYSGVIVVNPTEQTLLEYSKLLQRKATLEETVHEVRQQPAVTLDGKAVNLSANIEGPSDIGSVLEHGAEGVGLFRTEFLFINRDDLPSEEEQYQAYQRVAAALKPRPVIIRTLDLGGDKFISQLRLASEFNPFLGWRAIRFCLAQPQLFCAQLRAILRASVEGNVKMMYPMISGLDELNQANALVEKCKAELRAEGIPFGDKMEIGVMIEIPSAVLVADALAKRVNFFSIGSNDLIQYALAADRTNEKVAHLYEPTHPAIIRLLKLTIDAAHEHKIWVGVCGEIAGELALVPLLLGLGVDELSAAPPALEQIKYPDPAVERE